MMIAIIHVRNAQIDTKMVIIIVYNVEMDMLILMMIYPIAMTSMI